MLLIGIGNELRGDDGAGRRVADAVEALGLPGVTVRSVQQLVPELAEELAGLDVVVFVDADPQVRSCTVRRVADSGEARPAGAREEDARPADAREGDAREPVTHHATPAGLFRLARLLGLEPPPGYVIHVPAPELGLGIRLSPDCAAGVRVAVQATRRLVGHCPPDASG